MCGRHSTTDAIGGMGWGSETVIRWLIQSTTPAECVRAKKLTSTSPPSLRTALTLSTTRPQLNGGVRSHVSA